MPILSKYYDLITEITIANDEVVTIDPNKPYTITYLIGQRDCAQATGIIRGVINDVETIAVISLDAENVNFSTTIITKDIIKVGEYAFNAHFKDFNNWIGVEVNETSRIDLRLRYTGGECIVPVSVCDLYDISYVTKVNGNIELTEGTGKIVSIVRSTTKEAMPSHINHFTNDIDYQLVVDFGEKNASNKVSINVIDIRDIALHNSINSVDTTEYDKQLKDIYTNYIEGNNRDYMYTTESYNVLKDAFYNARMHLDSDVYFIVDDVEKLMNPVTEAVENLKLAENEYDLITYDKNTNTINCHDSLCQVYIEECECECIKVSYFTNFGTKKTIFVKNNATLIWDDGEEYNVDKPNPEYFRTINNSPASLVIEGVTLNDVYLGHSNDNEGIVVMIDKETKIANLYAGSKNTAKCSGSGNRITIVNKCEIGALYAGSDCVTIAEPVEDNAIQLIINNSTIDELYMGGNNNITRRAVANISNDSTIGQYYGTGTGSDIRSAVTDCSVGYFYGSEVTDIISIADNAESNTQLVSMSDSKAENVILGGKEAIGGSKLNDTEPGDPNNPHITSNVILLLQLADNSTVNNLKIGYSEGNKIDKSHIKVTIPKVTIENDEDSLIE